MCNDLGRNNIGIHGTQRKIIHKNAHIHVVNFCESKQSVPF